MTACVFSRTLLRTLRVTSIIGAEARGVRPDYSELNGFNNLGEARTAEVLICQCLLGESNPAYCAIHVLAGAESQADFSGPLLSWVVSPAPGGGL